MRYDFFRSWLLLTPIFNLPIVHRLAVKCDTFPQWMIKTVLSCTMTSFGQSHNEISFTQVNISRCQTGRQHFQVSVNDGCVNEMSQGSCSQCTLLFPFLALRKLFWIHIDVSIQRSRVSTFITQESQDTCAQCQNELRQSGRSVYPAWTAKNCPLS